MPVEEVSLQGTILSASIYSLGGMGDALLYPLLPVFGEDVGLSALWVGILLSINKYIRIFANSLLAYWTALTGYKRMLLAASVLATVTTLSYGVGMGLWLWLISRLLWGISFAALRITSLGYATEVKQQGFALGISRAIQEAGPLLALGFGPVLIRHAGISQTFMVLALFTAVGILLSLKLPASKLPAKQTLTPRPAKPGRLDIWVFISSFAVEGVLIVTLGLLLKPYLDSPEKVLGVTALYLSIRRLGTLLLTPLAGLLADYWNLNKLFLLSSAGISGGLLLLATRQTEAGIILTFIAGSINSAFVPGVALQKAAGKHKLAVLSALSTSRDAGSASGMLLGIMLFEYFSAVPLFSGLALLTGLLILWLKKCLRI
ncbi:major facilitator superfamily protein [Flammeovirgaceae bacterium 311]|nr:major facilitator superfamily protein [Flammeovirgaceae bacterium 311]